MNKHQAWAACGRTFFKEALHEAQGNFIPRASPLEAKEEALGTRFGSRQKC